MDGTILNTLRDITGCMNEALESAGLAHHFSEKEIQFCFGCGIDLDIEKSMALAKGCPIEDIEKAGAAIPVSHWQITKDEEKKVKDVFQRLYSLRCNDHAVPYDGVKPMLLELKKEGYKLGVASNKNQREAERLAALHFPRLFDGVIGSHEGIRKKPNPDMIDQLLDMFHVKHENAVYIGDSEVDLETARNAGLSCITVSWGFRGRSFLEKHNASVIADDCHSLFNSIHQWMKSREQNYG
jgi:phosphoglycolate phosphatase